MSAHVGPEPVHIDGFDKLRRLDWRFLLPTPPEGSYAHVVVLGGPPGIDRQLIECGFVDRVSTHLGDERVDAVVCLAGSIPSFDAVARRLRPGGVCYLEFDRSIRRPHGGMARAMRTSGLIVTGTYWVRPDFTAPELFLPLDRPAALRWYAATFFHADTPGRRLLAALLPLALRLGAGGLLTLGPRLALIATTGAGDVVREPAQNDTHPLILAGGADERSRVVLFPFTTTDQQPRSVWKAARHPRYGPTAIGEQETLATIHSALPPVLSAALPMPLGMIAQHRVIMAGESYLAGRRVLLSSGSWRARWHCQLSDLRAVGAWLGAFHATTARRHCWDTSMIERWVAPVLDECARMLDLSPTEVRLFARARERAAICSGLTLPVIWHHGDCNPQNVLRGLQRTVIVLDWEHAQLGLPLCDLLSFAVSWDIVARGADTPRAQDNAFSQLFLSPCTDDVRVDATRIVIDTYLRTIDLAAEFVPLFHVVTWARHARDEVLRLRLRGVDGTSRAENRYARYLGALADSEDFFAAHEGRA